VQKNSKNLLSETELVEQDIKQAVQTGMIVPTKTIMRARFASMMEQVRKITADVDQTEENLEDEIVENLERVDKMIINCAHKADDPLFKGTTGMSFNIMCPSGCLDKPGQVVGAMIYERSSSVCLAGIHSGFILPKGGSATLVIANGQDKYHKLYQNEVQSEQQGAGASSFTFKGAPKVINVGCEETLQQPRFDGKPGTIYQLMCPSDCQESEIHVYGVDTYSSDSSICQASMHYGTLTSLGGIIKLVIVNAGKPYIGSERKGIRSEPRQMDSKSFKVLGDIKDACNFFEEKYA
jgi:hypothetical protein